MNLKEELNQIKCKNIPLKIQSLLDNGLIQECEELNGIYYITFAFRIIDKLLYNYEYKYARNFVFAEYCSIIYCGGMAIDSKLKVIRGVIYPYYYDYCENSDLFDTSATIKQVIPGTPQIITKAMNTKLSDWFTDDGFKVFNLITNKSNTWGLFINENESYNGCDAYLSDDGIISPDELDESSYFGNAYRFSDYKKLGWILRYKPIIVSSGDVLTLEYISKFINSNTLSKSIIANIYCANAISKAIQHSGNQIKEGFKNIEYKRKGSSRINIHEFDYHYHP